MERDIQLAVFHAVELARSRDRVLASLTLRGAGIEADVVRAAASALKRHGVVCSDIRFISSNGPVSLAQVELAEA